MKTERSEVGHQDHDPDDDDDDDCGDDGDGDDHDNDNADDDCDCYCLDNDGAMMMFLAVDSSVSDGCHDIEPFLGWFFGTTLAIILRR